MFFSYYWAYFVQLLLHHNGENVCTIRLVFHIIAEIKPSVTSRITTDITLSSKFDNNCFLSYSADRQTDRSAKHNLFGRGNNNNNNDNMMMMCLMHVVPPELIIEPRSQTVNQGQTVTLDCVADGEPTPQISWRRGRTAISATPQFNNRFTVLHNNSLRSAHNTHPPTHTHVCSSVCSVSTCE